MLSLTTHNEEEEEVYVLIDYENSEIKGYPGLSEIDDTPSTIQALIGKIQKLKGRQP